MSFLHYGNSWSPSENAVIDNPDNNTIETLITNLNKDTLFLSLHLDKCNRMYLIQMDHGFQVNVESVYTSYVSSSSSLSDNDVIVLLNSYNEEDMAWKTIIKWKNTTIYYWGSFIIRFFLLIIISPLILLLSLYLNRILPKPYSAIAYWSCLFLFIIAFVSGIILSVMGSLFLRDRFKDRHSYGN